MNVELTVIFTVQSPDIDENDIEDLCLNLDLNNLELCRTTGAEPVIERAKFLEYETINTVAVV